MEPYNLKVYLTRKQVAERVRELGVEISKNYAGKNPILVSVLKGGVVFLADLIRHMDIMHSIDFMMVSSYRGTTSSSGNVRIVADLATNIYNRHVILVEDIYDTGLTLKYLMENLKLRKPASLSVCALLYKEKERKDTTNVEYIGFRIPDRFVVGYGLDYDEHLRNLNDICFLEFER